jgi:hypothetical protein
MTSFAATPTYPVPGVVKLTFTLTESGANHIRAWLVDAPKGSALKAQLVDSQRSRIEIYSGPGGATDEAVFEPDKPGGYRITMQEYDKGASDYGGGYQDSEDGYQTEAALGSGATDTLYVGQRMTQGVGYGASTGQLLVYVFDDQIRATSVEVQGEASPEIINTSNDAARIAALDSDVQTQLAALDDAVVSTVVGTISASIDNIITRYELHRVNATYHATTQDTDNTIDASFFNPSGPAGLVASLNEIRLKLDLHMRNAKESTPATGTQAYHDPTAGKRADLVNMILAPPADAADMSTVYALLGDIYRAYEAHRVSETPTGVHDADDPTALNALAALPDLHRYYCDSLRQANPTLPAGSTEQTGAVELTQTAGFKDAS